MLKEVIELEYYNPTDKRTFVVLFKCDWYDPTENIGWKAHPQYDLTELNSRRHFQKYEPFILASQAQQVYFTEYASRKRERLDWRVVYKIRARNVIDFIDTPYQETDPSSSKKVNPNDEITCLRDQDNENNQIDLQLDEGSSDNETDSDENNTDYSDTDNESA